LAIAAITLSFLLTPGPIQSGTSLSPDNPLGIEVSKHFLEQFAAMGILVELGIVIAAAISLVRRLRRAEGDERQQLKWFAYAAALLAVAFVVGLTLDGFGFQTARAIVLGVAVFGIPIGAGIAILKYRLYDIDLVINRTVLFGILAAFVTLVYVAIVVGIGALVGSKSNVILSVVATAIIALAFQPARNRARHLANRLVYGKRATPYEVLSDFSDRVAGTYASEDVLPRMAQILGQGIGSREAQVWLRIGAELRLEAAWPEGSQNGSKVLLPLSAGEAIPAFPEADDVCQVTHQGELLGALVVAMPRGETLTPVQQKLLQDLGRQAGLVLRNVRLIEELRASRQRLVAAQDDERRRLERNLHDGAQQQLVALAIKAKLAANLVGRDDERVRQIIGEVQVDAGETLEALRDLARGIYPPLLADQGLVAALQAQTRRAVLPVEIEANGLGRYPRDVEAAVYFCCLEGLQNVAKYASATKATIRLTERDGALTFEVEDDGAGFDTRSTPMGTGVQGMADRLDALGGRLEVRSAPGGGTTVTGWLPLAAQQN
jgi:signal transduction histidine kinase